MGGYKRILPFGGGGGGGGGVTSVNGDTGPAVILTASDVGADPTGTAQALFDTIKDKYVRTTRFAIISAGTSGTVTLPANSTVILDDFGGTTDAVVAQVSGGKPLLQSAKTAGGEVIATTFNTSGDWSFSGTPSAYDVAILYRVRQKLSEFDSDSSDIFGVPVTEGVSQADLDLKVDKAGDTMTGNLIVPSITDPSNNLIIDLTNAVIKDQTGTPLIYLDDGSVPTYSPNNTDGKIASVEYADASSAAAASTKESSSNKDNGALSSSSTTFPTSGAVKTYVDTGLATKQNTLGYTAENVANKDNGTISSSTTTYPTSGAVKTELDLRAKTTDIQIFNSSGTWIKPAGAVIVDVYLLGGGGGGGSGRSDVAGTVRCGGGGGASGVLAWRSFQASLLGSSETITVASGGTGGAGVSTVSNGNPGSDGGTSYFGTWLKALGGGGGGGGTNASGIGGTGAVTASTPWNFLQRGGAAASVTGTNGSNGATSETGPTGGGAGGGLSSTDAVGTAGAGGALTGVLSDTVALVGGLAGGVAPANAGNGNSAAWIFGRSLGSGGGGSRASKTSNTGNGGDGMYGSGGGGAGAVLSGAGFTGGNGGKGGDGWCVVVTRF